MKKKEGVEGLRERKGEVGRKTEKVGRRRKKKEEGRRIEEK